MSFRAAVLGVWWFSLCVVSVPVDKPPGIVVRLKPSAANFASDYIAKHSLADSISWKMNYPKKNESCAFGRCSVRNVTVDHHSAPVSNVTFVPGFGIEWKLHVAEIDLSFDFQLNATDVDEHVEGRANVRLSNLSVAAEIVLERAEHGSLRIMMTKCSTDFRSIESDAVTMPQSGYSKGSQGFYDRNKTEILRYFQDRVTQSVNSSLCELVQIVSWFIPDGLNFFNFILSFQKMYFDGTLAREMILKSDYIEIAFRGEFRMVVDDVPVVESSFQPSSFSLPPEDSNMIVLYLSDYVVNTLGEVFFKKGWLSQTITADIFSRRPLHLYKNYRNLFDTSCNDTFCFKTIFPNIADEYPNASVKFKVRATSPPSITFSQQAQTFHCDLDLGIVIPEAARSKISLATLPMSLSKSANVSFLTFSDRVVFVVTSPNITITDEGSPAKFASYEPRLNFVLKTVMNSLLIPWCNIYGAIGYPIYYAMPTDIPVRFSNLGIGFESGVLRLGTDIGYDPTPRSNENFWRNYW